MPINPRILISAHDTNYFAHVLTWCYPPKNIAKFVDVLVDAQVDLSSHQAHAA